MVPSLAPKILSTSESLLVTAHEDALRLWSTSDGRCLAKSATRMLGGARTLIATGVNGMLLVFSGSLYLVDAYTMRVADQLDLNLETIDGVAVKQSEHTIQVSVLSAKGLIQAIELRKKIMVFKSAGIKQRSDIKLDCLEGRFQPKLAELYTITTTTIESRIGSDLEKAQDSRGPHKELLDWRPLDFTHQASFLAIDEDRICRQAAGTPALANLLQFERNVDAINRHALDRRAKELRPDKWLTFARILDDQVIGVDSDLKLHAYGLDAKVQGQLWERDLFTEAFVRQEPHAKTRYMTKEDRQIEVDEFLAKLRQ